jgi:hypothetical protein
LIVEADELSEIVSCASNVTVVFLVVASGEVAVIVTFIEVAVSASYVNVQVPFELSVKFQILPSPEVAVAVSVGATPEVQLAVIVASPS